MPAMLRRKGEEVTDKVVNLREASKSAYIQVTPNEALDMAKKEPSKKVIIIMVGEDEGLSYLQGGGVDHANIVWYLERVKHDIIS